MCVCIEYELCLSTEQKKENIKEKSKELPAYILQKRTEKDII